MLPTLSPHLASPASVECSLLPPEIYGRFRGREVVEFMSANDEGSFGCFAGTIKQGSQSWLTVVRGTAACERSRRRNSLHVVCQDYRNICMMDADIFIWRQQLPHLGSAAVLQLLRRWQLAGRIRATAQAIIVAHHTTQWGADDLWKLRSLASWSRQVQNHSLQAVVLNRIPLASNASGERSLAPCQSGRQHRANNLSATLKSWLPRLPKRSGQGQTVKIAPWWGRDDGKPVFQLEQIFLVAVVVVAACGLWCAIATTAAVCSLAG